MEQVETTSGTDYRHYVYAGNEAVAILSRKTTLVNTWSYLLSDHVSSVSAITSSTGTVDITESFTSFGARRNPTTWSGAPASSDLTTIAGLSREGFTFQTTLGQSMGLNHLNGRVQDAITGRFLSPDPNIPDATNAQGFNRFSYVVNNPLSYIDPSGFGWICPASTTDWGQETDLQVQEVTVSSAKCNSDGLNGLPAYVCTGNCGIPTSTNSNSNDGSGGAPNSAPKPAPPPGCNTSTSLGNSLEDAAVGGTKISTLLEVGGAVATVGGVVTGAEAVAVVGVAGMGTRGAVGVLSTMLQIAGGVAQMIGGNTSVGRANAMNGSLTLLASAGSAWLGQSLLSQGSSVATRAYNAMVGQATAAAGAVADSVSSISPLMSPQTVSCPSRN